MVRDTRIKEITIQQQSVGAVNFGPLSTDTAVNGMLTRIKIQNPNTAGSLYFVESGCNTPILTYVVTSGTDNKSIYPTTYVTTNTGVTGSPDYSQYAFNDKILVTGSGFTSGTANVIGPINYYYL